MMRRRFLSSGCLISSAVFGWTSGEASGAAESGTHLVVVVRKASSLSELSLRDLKRLYIGEQLTDPSSNKLIPLNQPTGSPQRVTFERVVLKMGPEVAARFWIDRKIRGQTPAPRSVTPLEQLLNTVESIAGTLAYVRAGDVDARFKVLSIDGRRPGDAEYPLHE